MILVHSSGEDGFCYVQTKSLDGETNLKLKKAHKDLYHNNGTDANLCKLRGSIECAAPNNELYRCDVSVNDRATRTQLDINNTCLRGMILKNTQAVVGIAIYTGHDTRIQMNNEKARYK
jgi:magnesium-transporting ATPase (P-type)